MLPILQTREDTIRFILLLVRYLKDGTVRHELIIKQIEEEAKEVGKKISDFLTKDEVEKLRIKGEEKASIVNRALNWFEVSKTNPDIKDYAVKKARTTLEKIGLKPEYVGISEEDLSGAMQ
jgi:hypothetical protein